MNITYRKGAVGAMMDEYARAAAEFRRRLVNFLVRTEIDEDGGFGILKIKNDSQVIFDTETPIVL